MDSSKCATRCFSNIGVLVTTSHCEVFVVYLFPYVELNFVWSLVIVVWVGGGRTYPHCTGNTLFALRLSESSKFCLIFLS